MLFSKMGGAVRKTLLCGLPLCAILLPCQAATAAGNMGDPSAPMRRTAAAYPEFFAPNRDVAADPAPERVQRCKNPPGLAATDWRCRRR